MFPSEATTLIATFDTLLKNVEETKILKRNEKSKEGTKSPWYESSMVRKVHKWYERLWYEKSGIPWFSF